MLSTPPAFILSQDQTLVKSVCPVQNNSGHLLNLWIVFCNPFYCFLEIFIFWRCSLKIYKKFSGMVYDSVFNVLLFLVVNLWLMTCAPSGASFSRCYQQLLYLITDSSVCQQLFYLFFSESIVVNALHLWPARHQTLLSMLFAFFLKSCSLKRQLVYNNT